MVDIIEEQIRFNGDTTNTTNNKQITDTLKYQTKLQVLGFQGNGANAELKVVTVVSPPSARQVICTKLNLLTT